jgi:hypothetical protein
MNGTPRLMRALIAVLCLLLWPRPVLASDNGHGPVFGGATPTLGKGGWQFDQAWMGRIGESSNDDEQMLRSMFSFGVTEDLQISASLPLTLETGLYMPRGRMTPMMSSMQDFEAIGAWRFQRRAVGPGARLESTVFLGGAIPLQEQRTDGMQAAPSVYVAAATGYASRAHYFWISGGYQHWAERSGDQVGDTVTYSVVYGLRPPALQWDYPRPDLRFFVEAVGEHTSRGTHGGTTTQLSGGDAVLVGPTLLLLYKAYGIEGGALFPVFQHTNFQPRERFRFAVNFSYFFWLK